MLDGQVWSYVFSQFHFLRPLWLLIFLPMAGLVYLRWKLDATQPLIEQLPKHLHQALTIGEQGWRKNLPLKILAIIITIAIVICAGPTWQREAAPFGEDRANLMIVLDNSASMLEEDLSPNRLVRGKQKIYDLLVKREGGSTGLIVFAGSAHIALPLTQDINVFNPILAAISPDIMPQDGKLAASALTLLDDHLGQDLGSTILLVSDGIDPHSLQAYQTYFAQHEHQLLILATGNNHAASNNPMDLHSLQKLAKVTGGKLIELTVDQYDIERLDRYIERNMHINGDLSMPWQDMGYNLIILLAVMQLLWFRRGWLVKWCVTGILLVSFSHAPLAQAENDVKTAEYQRSSMTIWESAQQRWWDLWLTPDQQGQRWFNQKQYLEAGIHFSDPLRKGTAYYYAGQYQLAYQYFLQVNSPKGQLYAGNALARQREYIAARTVYETLLTTPLEADFRWLVENNLQVIQGIIAEVNRTSADQSGTTDGPEESFELGDNPLTGEGTEENIASGLMLTESLNENEILGSAELADKWLKKVAADPKYFLQAKFQLQALEQSRLNLNNGDAADD
ncbi:hypothetical protein BCU68_14500 [Vibrio sp. 10N.286.49.B3]|uniref:vWA domain-containing protein n=1 Tax=Vibrio sp. 10N.286.49.B3 TaxID=1880855 RepID=UPI000C84E2B1|nr:VWA domain-containing protein [Vibrio sp. 10N.286.49.B3]PMH42214.1 hypothetical protein BCU68_14500 [Vibrio sp. 10N.286.49.B3]